jgi:hypothetical protein
MAVAVPPDPVFTPGPPRALFPVAGYRVARNRPSTTWPRATSVFLMIREPAATGGTMCVEHWFTEPLAKVKR